MKKNCLFILSILICTFFLSCKMETDDSPSKTSSNVLFMMYLDGDNSLSDVTWKNLYDAELGLMNLSQNATINVVALVDGNPNYGQIYERTGKTYLYKLGALTQEEIAKNLFVGASTIDYSKATSWVYNGSGRGTQEVDMSSGNTLYNFLNWANTNFSADKKILVFHNHGGGPAIEQTISQSSETSARSICLDDTTGTDAYLKTEDITNAISRTFGKVDMIIEDVCLEGAIELIYGLQDVTNYIIASPNLTSTNSYHYEKIVKAASEGLSVLELGKKIVDFNYEHCKNMTLRTSTTSASDSSCMEYSLSLYDCTKKDTLSAIKTHTSALADKLLAETDESQIALIKNSLGKLSKNTESIFYGFFYNGSYFYMQDLGVTAYIFANANVFSDGIKAAASDLYNDLAQGGLIAYSWAGGSENNWYYSADASYGKADGTTGDFLRTTLAKGTCPWGISITAGRNNSKIDLSNYGTWTSFAGGNSWATLLSQWKNYYEK